MEYIKIKTVYVDMDGVLADFKGHFKHLFDKDVSSIGDPEIWGFIEKYGKAKFFEELPWTSGGRELWNFVTKNFMNVKILTALGKSDKISNQTRQGKKSWLSHHIPNLSDSDINMVQNKHQKKWYSRPGDIIIDDTPIVIDEWNKKDGIGILYTNIDEVIRKLEQYIYE